MTAAGAYGNMVRVGESVREKYDRPGRARRYRERSPRRNREEWRLVERALQRLDPRPSDALDVPCGTGRIAERLLDLGIPTRAADLSPAMLSETRARLEGREGFLGAVSLDLQETSGDPEIGADLVVCFRFLQHLEHGEQRAPVLRGLAALCRRDLLLSFHHPVSFHNLERKALRLIRNRRADRFTITPGRLEREAAAQGLELVGLSALGRYRRELWLAHLRPS